MTKKIIFTILVGFLTHSKINAQQSINASGANASGSAGSVSITIGQIAYTSAFGSNGSINQGVQQPFEINTLSGQEFESITLQATVYPNPTTGSFTLTVKDFSLENLNYQVLDVQGHTILSDKASEQNNINIENETAGMYLVNVQVSSRVIKTFKIIKK